MLKLTFTPSLFVFCYLPFLFCFFRLYVVDGLLIARFKWKYSSSLFLCFLSSSTTTVVYIGTKQEDIYYNPIYTRYYKG